MDDAELVGGVLVDAADPRDAARQLADLLLAPRVDRIAATRAGLHRDLVEVLRARIGTDRERVTVACQEGAAWVLGRRSVVVGQPWDLVASLPSGTALPGGLRRTTGETLVQLVVQATTTLRLAAPFIDRPGLSFVGDALAAATGRGVRLEILLPLDPADPLRPRPRPGNPRMRGLGTEPPADQTAVARHPRGAPHPARRRTG